MLPIGPIGLLCPLTSGGLSNSAIVWMVIWPSAKIFQELLQKGINRETAETAWEEAVELENPNERELLKRTVEKRCSFGSELDEREMRRLYGYLSRRGFRSGEISSVLEEMEITVVYTCKEQ